MADVEYIECDECGYEYTEVYPACPCCSDDPHTKYAEDHEEFIKSLGSIGKALAWRDPFGLDILSYVVIQGLSKEVTFWLAHGADLNHTDYCGQSAVKLALINEHYRTARKLIKSGADCSPFIDHDLKDCCRRPLSEKRRRKEHRKTKKCIERYTARDKRDMGKNIKRA